MIRGRRLVLLVLLVLPPLLGRAEAAALHHTIKITATDGYFVILSTGEIAPDLGGKPALVAYQHGDDPPGGFRLVMPGDKHGARNARDITAIDVE
jgi:hypothetical protein